MGLPYLEQHQLGATVQVQGKPVPAGLPGRQRLTAPFPVQPGLPGNRDAQAATLDLPLDLVERLAVIVRSLALA
ncbi:hypothetical protein D9M68_866840 [compost metagenome]